MEKKENSKIKDVNKSATSLKGGDTLISFTKAKELVLKNVSKGRKEYVSIEESYHRFLASNIKARNDVPHYARSMMDGYAAILDDLKKLPSILRTKGVISAGETFKRKIKKGECVKIMTGAVVPKNADVVVPIENTEDLGNGFIKIFKKPKERFINPKGEFIKKGEIILKKGKFLREFEIGTLASFGIKKVPVYKLPKVSIISTGNELIDFKEKLRPGKIKEINSIFLNMLFKRLNISPKFYGIVKDNKNDLKKTLLQAIESSDIVITIGGVSVGDYDLVPTVLNEIGVKKIFHRVSVKPGRPIFFGKFKDKLIFGLPGNSVSGIVSFFNFIKPSILKMIGKEDNFFEKIYTGILQKEINFSSERFNFLPCKIENRNGTFFVSPVKYVCSADIVSLTKLNGFILLKEGKYNLKKGDNVNFIFV